VLLVWLNEPKADEVLPGPSEPATEAKP
jgi:hypothetical protein